MIIKKVTEGIYRRAGAPTDFKQALQFRTILNLEDDPVAINTERMRARACGIQMLSLPLSEWSRPAADDLRDAVKILICAKMHPILVHCKHDQDRTGYVIAAYRMIVQGWSLDKAYKEAIAEGHKWLWYWRWKKSLKEVAG